MAVICLRIYFFQISEIMLLPFKGTTNITIYEEIKTVLRVPPRIELVKRRRRRKKNHSFINFNTNILLFVFDSLCILLASEYYSWVFLTFSLRREFIKVIFVIISF